MEAVHQAASMDEEPTDDILDAIDAQEAADHDDGASLDFTITDDPNKGSDE